jgi:hypothetical protein
LVDRATSHGAQTDHDDIVACQAGTAFQK